MPIRAPSAPKYAGRLDSGKKDWEQFACKHGGDLLDFANGVCIFCPSPNAEAFRNTNEGSGIEPV